MSEDRRLPITWGEPKVPSRPSWFVTFGRSSVRARLMMLLIPLGKLVSLFGFSIEVTRDVHPQWGLGPLPEAIILGKVRYRLVRSRRRSADNAR